LAAGGGFVTSTIKHMSLETFGIIAGLLCIGGPIYLLCVFARDCQQVTKEYQEEHNLDTDENH
jgi:hypothetical protein